MTGVGIQKVALKEGEEEKGNKNGRLWRKCRGEEYSSSLGGKNLDGSEAILARAKKSLCKFSDKWRRTLQVFID